MIGYTFAKRLLDLLFVVVTAPLAITLVSIGALLSLIAHRSNPFFTQDRTGLKGEVFRIYKLKTMHDVTETRVSDDERLTTIGALLRKTSIDELPQLWNVFTGSMTVVGPRPQLQRYSALMTAEEFRRHDAKPGITGWAQVNGRNSVTWRERFKMDVWYVDNASFWLDLRILLKTVIYVISATGNSDGKSTTMTPLEIERKTETVR